MRAGAIGTVEVGDRRRGSAAKGPIIAHIRPESTGLGPAQAGGEHGNGRVVAVDLLGGKYVGAVAATMGSSSQAAWPTQSHRVERSSSRPWRA